MKIVYSTIIQLTIISRVVAMSFENIIKSLPADIPVEFKNIMLDLYMKHPKEFAMPESDLEGMAHKELKAPSHDYQKKNKVVVQKSTTAKIKPPVKGAAKINKVTSKPKILRTDTSAVRPPCAKTTVPTKAKTATVATPRGNKPGVPRQMLAPVPVPVPMPVPMPVYQRVPVLLPMKSYFEPVMHDHPPIYEIQDLIEAEEKRWKNLSSENNSKTSLEKRSESADSDSNTDTSSEETNVGSDYYDALIRIKG